MTVVRTGVIGVGHLGYHHARLYSALDESELVGIVDANPDRAADVAADFSVPVFDSIEALLAEGIDAASVAVPTTAHHDVVQTLLGAGVDVLVEKPMATTVDQAKAMAAAARDGNRILQVGHIERFNGAVTALLGAIHDPRFIECHRLSPYPNRGDDVSVVLDLMIHDLDVVLALDSSEVVSIDAIGVPVFSRSEDIANVRIRFKSGCVANLTASRVSLDRMRKIRIFERNAYVSTDYSEQEVLVYRKKPGALSPGASPMEAITVEPLVVTRDEPLKLELAAFLHSVKTRDRPAVSGEEGLRALELAHAILEFIREHS